jgi:hypothetical protein
VKARRRADPKTPAVSWVASALKALVVRVDARRVTGELSGCWDRWETGVDSARASSVARCCRLGTAGRLGTERLMRLPRRMYSLGKGSRPGSEAGYGCPLEPGGSLAGRFCRACERSRGMWT